MLYSHLLSLSYWEQGMQHVSSVEGKKDLLRKLLMQAGTVAL